MCRKAQHGVVQTLSVCVCVCVCVCVWQVYRAVRECGFDAASIAQGIAANPGASVEIVADWLLARAHAESSASG